MSKMESRRSRPLLAELGAGLGREGFTGDQGTSQGACHPTDGGKGAWGRGESLGNQV